MSGLIKRIAVRSSNIGEIGYDEADNALEILFTDGHVYLYTGVPKDVFLQFVSAPSKGKFFRENIRESFPYTKTRGG